jgi:hypothetical protein
MAFYIQIIGNMSTKILYCVFVSVSVKIEIIFSFSSFISVISLCITSSQFPQTNGVSGLAYASNPHSG